MVNSIHAIDEAKKNGRPADHYIEISALQRGDGVLELSVQDSGSGISKENLSQLFKPFFTTKAIGQGTGLGLAITNKIVLGWGGTIKVESQLGRGTKFMVNFKQQETL